MTKNKIFACLCFLLLLISEAYAHTIRFGKTGKIVYDMRTGTFNAYIGSKEILHQAYSSFKEKNQKYDSRAYAQRTYSKTKISDGFGKGLKHVFSLTAKGMPNLKQVFYTYDHLPYFLCEIEISGSWVSSNEMVALQGEIPVLKNFDKARSIFVPFDNDTFISYESKQLRKNEQQLSAEVGVIYDPILNSGLISGSVTHGQWKTGVSTGVDYVGNISIKVQSGFTQPAITRDSIPHGTLSGKAVISSKIFYGLFEDWRTGMERYAEANRTAEPPIVFKWNQATPLGWNSWGAMQEKISFDKLTKVVDFFADSLKTFRSEGTLYIDLDSYWDNMLVGGLEGDYSRLKEFADYAKRRGLKPGIYWAPFTDWGYKAGGNRRAEGGNYKFSELWTKVGKGYHDIDGARALDPTHPGTQQRIALVIGKFRECGYEMIKVDFLGHAAIESSGFYDATVTTGMQAYKVGMEFLLKELKDKMLIYAAISPSMASGRYIHMRRIACDAFHSIKDTRYTLNSLSYGWWQSYLYDYIDADHVVFKNENLGASRARLLSSVITGTPVIGDDFSVNGAWKERAQELLQNDALLQVVADGKAFKPFIIDNDVAETFLKEVDGSVYIAFFNFSDKEKTYTVPPLVIAHPEKYKVENVFGHKSIPFSTFKEIKLQAEDAVLFKISNN